MLARLAGINGAARELADGPVHATGIPICTRDGSSPGSRASGAPAAAVRRSWRSRPFARRSCCGSLTRRGSFGVLGDTAAQRLHEIDHPLGRGKGLLALLNGARLLGLEVHQQRLLVAVPEGRGVKFCGLAVEKGGRKPNICRCMLGAVLSWRCLGRHRLRCQPCSRIGENPPYGMIGGIEETSASSKPDPRLDPTRLRGALSNERPYRDRDHISVLRAD